VTTLRVLSYNVLSLRLGTEKVAAVIRACDPDVVCVQEAPRFLLWKRKCRALATATGLTVVTGGRPAGAVLLLARPGLRVVTTKDVKLPWHPPLHRRGMAIGVFDAGGTEVTVASTHLSLDDAERLAHVDLVLAHLAALGRPAILAGDVNEDPDDAAWRVLATAMADAYVTAPLGDGLTSTAVTPRRRIDAVFVDRALGVVSCGVPAVGGLAEASDHRPVLAVVKVT
jgi:endonuclease/exonuclease/phosphatase family metal-dependent hydrolase